MTEIQVAGEPLAVLQTTAADVLLARAPHLEDVSLRLDGADKSDSGSYLHYLFWYGVANVYLVLVADEGGSLRGYHRLDLNEKYGLTSPPNPVWGA